MTVPVETEDVQHAETAGRLPRRRSRRLALFFLVASVSLHAAVLVMWPGWVPDSDPRGVSALEVVILQPEPLPVAAVQPEQAQPPRQTERERKPAKKVPQAGAGQRAPVLALSKPEPAPEGSFVVAPTRPPEPSTPAADSKSRAASAAVVSPNFNAAYLSNPAPRYPLASRRAGEQGTVTLRVLVKPDGLPAQVEVERSSGSPHLDAAALEAVKGWRFVPARQGADPIESWVLVPVVFRLEGFS
jgi:protein TonB